LLVVISEVNAIIGSVLGGSKWKTATDPDLEPMVALVEVKPFSAIATRGGIALRITS
jgi:hypothetical protein